MTGQDRGVAGGAEAVLSLLTDTFGRIHEGVPAVVGGLSVAELLWRPDADANHIAWLVWHLTRQQDEQIADLAGTKSVWRSEGWADRFGLPYRPQAHGYGMTSEEVGAFTLSDPSVLTGYHADVHALTERYVSGLTTKDLDKVIDRDWVPPVTVSIRIVSVFDDAAKHLGQAEYVRGLVQRRR
jgi:hypothetical protein